MKVKKIGMILPAVLIGLLLFSVTALAETEGIFSYTVENGEATVTRVSMGGREEITVPETLGGYPVTGLRDNLFAGSLLTDEQLAAGTYKQTHPLKRVILPDGIKEIPSQLFLLQYSLEEVRLPADLERIGALAFGYCISLRQLELPDTVKAIQSGAFCDCWSLESLILPDGLQSVGEGNTGAVLAYTAGLRWAYIPAEIPFSYDSTVYDGQTRALSDVFYGGTRAQWEEKNGSRTDLQDVRIHFGFDISPYRQIGMDFSDGLLRLSGGALRLPGTARLWDVYADETESLILSDTVTALGEDAFTGFSALSSIVACGNVTLDAGAFRGCASLTNVLLPAGGTVSPDAFADCGEEINVFLADAVSSAAAGWNAVPVSYEDGILTYGGQLTQNAYDFFDVLSVFCDSFGRIDRLRVADFSFDGIPVYYEDAETGARTRLEGSLKNGEIYPRIQSGDGAEEISFNTLCAGIADHSITGFYLVISDAAHPETQDTQISVIEQIRNTIKKILRAIVTLLNKLFRLLKSFGK